MKIIQIKDKKFKKFISSIEIDQAISDVAEQINRDYKNDTPVLLITLNGAILFGSDLLKKLTIDCTISCIKVSSYAGIESTESMNSLIGINEDLTGKRVIIVEDIVDTGNTYEHIVNQLESQNVQDVRIATMTFKPEAYKKDLPIHYVGLSIPRLFVVGRGLDYDGLGRNLNDIYQLAE
ncbi:MAG TPA: phosphoribosyltransferase family protein [Bacteroidales bacterium]|nr:phosphoribosyltransferase family protein [Bacteroidales bacterium]